MVITRCNHVGAIRGGVERQHVESNSFGLESSGLLRGETIKTQGNFSIDISFQQIGFETVETPQAKFTVSPGLWLEVAPDIGECVQLFLLLLADDDPPPHEI